MTDNRFGRGPSRERALAGGIPPRWLYCPKIGEVVANRFVPFKTPLCTLYDEQLHEERLRFHPEDVFKSPVLGKKKIGLWVDLTKTDRYYASSEVEKHGAKYRKIALAGHEATPTEDEVMQFVRLVRGFIRETPDALVGIHCTHGFNRTGFLISAFLVEEESWDIGAAIQTFASCRSTGIYKQDYITDLFKRYGDEEDAFEAPQRPQWEYGEDVPQLEPSAPVVPQEKRGGKVFEEGRFPDVSLVTDVTMKNMLRSSIKHMCHYNRDGFPGSQPVSLERVSEKDPQGNLHFLHDRKYMVSWKADGTRYLVFIMDKDQVFAFDRDNEVFQLPRLTFPHPKEGRHYQNTLVDAELIYDKYDGKETPRLLIYDIVTYEKEDVSKMDFLRRTKRLEELFRERDNAAKMGELNKERELMSVRHKRFFCPSAIRKLFSEKFTATLGHEVDGLIFQPVNEGYICGRCDSVLKWKPPSHNSIDFKLKIMKEKKEGELPRHVGYLFVQHEAAPVAEMKATKALQKYDGKIIECRMENGQWIFMRERTDKSLPNSINTARSVFNSMRNPVTKELLCSYVEEHAKRLEEPDAAPPAKRPRPL